MEARKTSDDILLQSEKIAKIADQIYQSDRDGGVNNMVAEWAYEQLMFSVVSLDAIAGRLKREESVVMEGPAIGTLADEGMKRHAEIVKKAREKLDFD